VELKQSTGETGKIVETVCAFTNAGGGVVLIGMRNHGELRGVTIADLGRTHTSHPRNHRLARAFFLIRYIEQWGTGTLRMRELCQEAGLPVPEFAKTSGAFIVIFRKSKLTKESLEALRLNMRQIAAVEYTRAHGRITKGDYVQLTGTSARTATDELHEIVTKGILTPTGKGRARQYQLQGA